MLNHPFVYFRFDSGSSENFRAMNVVPLWVDDDQPPSYDEAVKMNPQKEETEVPAEMENVESNEEQILTTTTVIEMEQTSESESIVTEKASDSIGYFRRETSVWFYSKNLLQLCHYNIILFDDDWFAFPFSCRVWNWGETINCAA